MPASRGVKGGGYDLQFTIYNRIYTGGTVIEACGPKDNDGIEHVLFICVEEVRRRGWALVPWDCR